MNGREAVTGAVVAGAVRDPALDTKSTLRDRGLRGGEGAGEMKEGSQKSSTNMEQPQPQQPQEQSRRAVYRSTESLSVNEIELSSVLQTFKRVSEHHKRNSTMFSVSERSETTEPPETKDTNDATNDATNDDTSNNERLKHLETLEIAAFTHLVQWSETAERVKVKMRESDEETIASLHKTSTGCLFLLIRCCCPGFICCSHKNQKPVPPPEPSLLSSHSIYVRNIEAKYRCCCCCCRVPLNLLTAPFIWWNLPFGVVKIRIVVLLQTMAILLTTLTQWWFLIQMASSVTKYNKTKINIPKSAFYVSVGTFILPEMFHILYISFTPGYYIRSCKRNSFQIGFSLFAQTGIRPLYDLCWSFKWTQLMPYTLHIQNEGHIVADTGIHERTIVWQGLATTLREIPIRIAQLFILAEFWSFWRLKNFGTKYIKIKQVHEMSSGSICEGYFGSLNQYTILFSMVLGFFVSAFTLSDQLEREIPHGAFPRRFARILSSDLCGSTSLFWNFIFLLGFFVDLALRFAVIIPISASKGLARGFFVCVLFLFQTSFLCWYFMYEPVTDNVQDNDTTNKSSSLNRISSDAGPSMSRRRKDSRDSDLSTSKRTDTDNYDSGYMLDSTTLGGKGRKISSCSTIIETLPFIFWGIWVDLPLRLKWLRLKSGEEKDSARTCMLPKSGGFFIISTINSFLIVVGVFIYNIVTLNVIWKNGLITCQKQIPSTCFIEYNVTCPTNLTDAFQHVDYTTYNRGIQDNSSWILGCFDLKTERNCLPEMEVEQNNASIDLLRFILDSHNNTRMLFFFFSFLLIKLCICVLIVQQFYCVRKEYRGDLCCFSHSTEQQKGNNDEEDSTTNIDTIEGMKTVSQMFNTDRRKRRMSAIQHEINNDGEGWRSKLRARDVQLMLRFARLMPTTSSSSSVTQDEVDLYQVTKMVLGVAGKVDQEDFQIFRLLKNGLKASTPTVIENPFNTNIPFNT